MVLKCCLYVAVFLCISQESNILDVRDVFNTDACHVLKNICLAIIPVIWAVIAAVLTRTWARCSKGLLFALCFLKPCCRQGLICGCGNRHPRSISKLHCEVGGAVVLLLGEEPLTLPLEKLFTRSALWCHLSLAVQAHKVHSFWQCALSNLNQENLGSWPGWPLGALLTKPLEKLHWNRTVEVRY